MSRHRTFLDKQHYTFYYSNHRNEKLYELSFLSVYSQILGHIFHDFETASKSIWFGRFYTVLFSPENKSRDGIALHSVQNSPF